MTLEQYLRWQMETRGAIDFTFRAHENDGVITIYIHPSGRDGETTPTMRVHHNVVVMPGDWPQQ